MATTQEVISALDCRVYLGSVDSTYAAQTWTERTDLLAAVTHTCGSAPSTAAIFSWKDPEGTNPHPAIPGEAQTLRMPNGGSGKVFCPYGILPHTFVKVVAYSDAESADRVIFLGRVWRWHWNHQACRIDVIAEDYRREMNRTKLRHSLWYRPKVGDSTALLDMGPVFNAGGQADQKLWDEADDDVYIRQEAFITPDWNRADDGSVADTADRYSSAHWRPGDALNFLRSIFVDDPLAGIDDYSDILSWAAAVEDGGNWDFLFDDGSGNDRRLGQLDCCGRSLAWAVDQIVGTGPFDWTLEYSQDESGNGIAGLFVFELYSAPGSESGDLALGDVASRPVDESTEVMDVDWELDWTEAYANARVVGGRVRMDVTLDTDSGTLVPGWTSAQETAWEALPETTDKEIRDKQAAYPDVFLTWVAPANIDWSSFFAFAEDAASGEFAETQRRAFAELFTKGLTEAEATGKRIPLRMIVQRKVDGSWEDLPADVQAVPLSDGRVGFRLAATARQELSHGGEDAYTWSWDGADDYPMRVTISIETDDRVRVLATDGALSWPVGELYVDAGPRYRFGALSSAYVRVDTGEFVINGGTMTLTGNVTPYAIEDPYDEISAHAARALEKVARPRMRGVITVPWLWPELRPGYVVGKLTGGGVGGTRPDLDLYMAVREAVHDEAAQVTRIRFEGV